MTGEPTMQYGKFDSVLVANRGEIAVRVIRAARDEGIRTIAVHSEADSDALHVRLADESHLLPGTLARDTYLNIERLIDIALATDAQAVHPGYGFLSESAEFARAVLEAGLVWIGPPPQAIETLGDKVKARAVARSVGAPLVPGTSDPVSSPAEVAEFVAAHGLPIVIKAAFGGGGRGLRVVRDVSRIADELESATREASAAFGRGECFVERYLERPRHVEAQLLVDSHGNAVVVGTRDCSLQRRHQKLIEEAPAPFLSEEQTATIIESSVRIGAAAGYVGAGTVEFLVGADGMISFLEVNTRLQVEHPVTEETTGVDLVSEQFSIARGEWLRISSTPAPRGHSIEFRINSEDPAAGFRPAPGRITVWDFPRAPGLRLDAGVDAGSVVAEWYDSMLGKLIITGRDRRTTLARARLALDEIRIEGVPTVLPLDRNILAHHDFADTFAVHTGWIEEHLEELVDVAGDDEGVDSTFVEVPIGRDRHRIHLPGLAALGDRAAEIKSRAVRSGAGIGQGDVAVIPMQGTVVKVAVSEGDRVEKGDLIAAVEAMKMENAVLAHRAGVIVGLAVAVGDVCSQGEQICRIEADSAE
ncbi:acetyl-CoA/propionyl-CoA carboxylase biotin carboxyl carrier protein [Nocardia sp. GAS34]|uniref:acetyl/propionyl/methylcrotonyl-CoA carboxylase subunit alpha n=1 Tax=unclassified Nocardia TaxID=2637762 RepID=UPI003D1DEA73